ncbi:thioredoxin [Mesoterricola silvestris]|uniref:Thioredoxin n=1 Tax=Mesoterricola silvestris TaxID=2927979 RepID=A0AA48GR01_9BACT|nr:thioredoxin [Mesoterricola silvestris]BDU74519.1 thioredoxin [Mesoterricola silvestris]
MSDLTALTDATFQEAIAQGVTLVDFWAPWCGPCKALTPVLEKVAQDMAGQARILKMDIDANPDTAAALGIMSIPALVLFKDGKRVDQRGSQSAAQIRALIESAL